MNQPSKKPTSSTPKKKAKKPRVLASIAKPIDVPLYLAKRLSDGRIAINMQQRALFIDEIACGSFILGAHEIDVTIVRDESGAFVARMRFLLAKDMT